MADTPEYFVHLKIKTKNPRQYCHTDGKSLIGYLADVSLEDTQHLGQHQLLPAFDGQLLDPVPSLEEGLESGLDASALLSAQLLLQPLGQLPQRRQLDRTERGGV